MLAGHAHTCTKLGLAACALTLFACKGSQGGSDPPEAPASPQAKAIPAPLASVPAATPSGAPVAVSPDAGPPPVPLRGDAPLPADSIAAKEIPGYTMLAVFRPSELPAPTKGPEVSLSAIDLARKKTEPRVSIDLGPSRMRIVLATQGFVLPSGSELRARTDRYGHVVLGPDLATYRTSAPGTLRALIGERRLDVAPLSPADVTLGGEGARRLGLRTRKADVTTRAAKATFEIARVADSGEGGVLLCRALLDLINAPPQTPLCLTDDVPLHADLRWTTHGSIAFDALAIARRADLAPQSLAAPPQSARFDATPLGAGAELLVSPPELVAFRTSAVDVPGPPPVDPPNGLALINSTDELRFVWLDGVPVAWVGPGARLLIPGLYRGRYQLQWRTFLGDAIDPPEPLSVPAVSNLGGADAGVPPVQR